MIEHIFQYCLTLSKQRFWAVGNIDFGSLWHNLWLPGPTWTPGQVATMCSVPSEWRRVGVRSRSMGCLDLCTRHRMLLTLSSPSQVWHFRISLSISSAVSASICLFPVRPDLQNKPKISRTLMQNKHYIAFIALSFFRYPLGTIFFQPPVMNFVSQFHPDFPSSRVRISIFCQASCGFVTGFPLMLNTRSPSNRIPSHPPPGQPLPKLPENFMWVCNNAIFSIPSHHETIIGGIKWYMALFYIVLPCFTHKKWVLQWFYWSRHVFSISEPWIHHGLSAFIVSDRLNSGDQLLTQIIGVFVTILRSWKLTLDSRHL